MQFSEFIALQPICRVKRYIHVILNHDLLEAGTAGWTRTSSVHARTCKPHLCDTCLLYLESPQWPCISFLTLPRVTFVTCDKEAYIYFTHVPCGQSQYLRKEPIPDFSIIRFFELLQQQDLWLLANLCKKPQCNASGE